MITIDSVSYDVPIISLDETCEFLDKFAERTADGVLHRELIGTYHNQRLEIGRPITASEKAAYPLFWAKLTEATEFHTVTVPDADGVPFTFVAYFSSVRRQIKKWKPLTTHWASITVNFIAQSPRAT